MLTYSSTNFPPWATLSSTGNITILPTAPVGSQTVYVSVTNGTNSYSGSIVLNVLAKQVSLPVASLVTSSAQLLGISSRVRSVQSLLRQSGRVSHSLGVAVAMPLVQTYSPAQAVAVPVEAGVKVSLVLIQNGYGEYSGGY